MPGVLKYTPAWLSRPSPGFDVFASKSPPKLSTPEAKQKHEKPFGPQRTIARRGTEAFVAVGNELRWTDMVLLKERWDETQDKQNEHGRDGTNGNGDDEDEQEDEMGNDNDDQDKDTRSSIYHRTLKVPISRPIRQLIMSPREDYLAIVTSHTVHVAVLPASSHLSLEDTSSLNLKTYHIGPTTHVLERAPIASAVWHPLGSSGECLVTVTVDAVVRLWELDKDNRWSFDSPALAVDLRKLVNGHSSTEDFSPSKYGANKGFSPDSFEMEVASAYFGGSAVEGEDPWAAMTLWIAMREGDVYALCPLLPSKWVARPSMIIELSESIACSTTSDSPSGYSQRTRNQLKTWASDLASQESTFENENSYTDRLVMQRPLRPNMIPRLQGPFMISPEIDDMFDVTDIYAIPAIDNDEADPSEDGEVADELEPSAASLLCLATADGKVHILTGAGAVEGRWLPTRKATQPSKDDQDEEVELLLIESVSVGEAVDDVYPAFTADPRVHHAVFVTHGLGVSYLDLSSWSSKLADEYNSTDEAGVAFRIDMLLGTASTTVEQPIIFPTSSSSPSAISACIAISDSDLGFFVLCTADDQPHAATLSEPLSHFSNSLRLTGPDPTLLAEYLPTSETDLDFESPVDSRPAYQPPQAIWQPSSLPTFLDTHAHPRARRAMSDELRLSPAVLQLMVEAHRVTSTETHRLGFAVSELFRRCERLQEEFREQIRRVRECRDRIDTVLGEGSDEYTNTRGEDVEADGDASEVLERRMARARERQEALSERYAEVRRKVGRANGRPIGEKEDQWITEIRVMERMVGNGSGHDDGEDDGDPQLSAPKMPGGASVRAPRTEGDAEGHDGDATEVDDDHEPEDDSVTPASDLPHARFRQVLDLQRQLTAQVEEIQRSASGAGYEDDLSASMRSSTLQSSTSSRAGGERRRAAQAEIELLLERQTALLEATSGQIARLAGLGFA